MKLKCTQCGAYIAVTSPDAYVTCAYCGARAVVSGFTGQSFLHRKVLSREDVTRLFPPGAVSSASVYWFPYDPGTLERVFTQPYSEMEDYSPPSADRRIWNESEISDTIIPVDPDLIGEQGVIYHPFWVVINSSTGQGTIVDGVSGTVVGNPEKPSGSSGFNPYRESVKAFTTGIIPAVLIFFLLKGVSIFWASVLGMAAAVFAPSILDRIKERKS